MPFDPKRHYQTKESHYASMLDQDGNPIKVILIIIGENCTIHTKSREFLEELDLNIENVYKERIQRNQQPSCSILCYIFIQQSSSGASCAEEIYKRKQVMRDEENNLPEIRNVNLTNNRFAELVSGDIQIKEKSEQKAILEYLKEQQKLQNPKKLTKRRNNANPMIPRKAQYNPKRSQHLNETSDQLNSSIQINQNEILLSLAPAIQEEIQMELRMPNKTTVTKILAQQQNVQIAFKEKRPQKSLQMLAASNQSYVGCF
ncbi:Hypothetical_protein [Hexamita inflata]|uniref:Hypothetical_protein n=1 Tax=Hexamita inflata TaxID=28002 RepID=A0ABP1GSC8_9EUKA